ncbi:MAG: FHA domain-containing protein [Nitrospirota bacterium]
MTKLILKLNDKVIKEVLISKDRELTIGRDQTNDLQLDNLAVSRVHAKIYKQGWSFYIEDMDTTNGIYINDRMVSWKAALNNNDIITIGKYMLIFNDNSRDYENGKDRPFDPNATIKV